ncbi:hypothetical protein SPHINGOAX6_30189 [Sphingomonas sp. AX6]|nr:hypothetical protein SPHINGOAX6_30189 [Sphingomonas sp. AX6]
MTCARCGEPVCGHSDVIYAGLNAPRRPDWLRDMAERLVSPFHDCEPALPAPATHRETAAGIPPKDLHL